MSGGIRTVVVPTRRRMLMRRRCGMHLAFDDHCDCHADQQHSKNNICFTVQLRQHCPPRSQCYLSLIDRSVRNTTESSEIFQCCPTMRDSRISCARLVWPLCVSLCCQDICVSAGDLSKHRAISTCIQARIGASVHRQTILPLRQLAFCDSVPEGRAIKKRST